MERLRTENELPGRRALMLGACSSVLLLTACTPDSPLATQAREGANKNYIAGDGSVSEYVPESRGEPVELSGELYDGRTVRSADWKDKVVVLNFWYAACTPCRVEAPALEELHQEFKEEGVLFYGVNLRDSPATAAAFERSFGTTYPSFDSESGILLALSKYVPPQAVPTTLVLDRNSQVAARILGVAERGTLKALISDATR